MSIASALAAGRTAAEALMTDTVTIRYATGNVTPDPDTLSDVPEFADRFTSKAKIQARNLQARTADVGGRTATTVVFELHLPLSAPEVKVGDIAEVMAIGDLSDAQLLGQKFRVVAPAAKSFATARRLEVEEVVS